MESQQGNLHMVSAGEVDYFCQSIVEKHRGKAVSQRMK